MRRIRESLAALALLLALAPVPVHGERVPESVDALSLGRQVAGPRLTEDDLEGRVVFAYHWCVS